MVKRILAVAFIGAALLVTACGGGGSETDEGNNPDIIVVQDTLSNDLVVNPDTVDRDTVTPEDTNVPEDTVITACEGACEYGTDGLWCLADGLTICYCGEENTWAPYVCADVCLGARMVGDQCGEVEGSPNCMCEFDCTNTELTAGQCEDMSYTPCTCAAADPCSWVGDGYCDNFCQRQYPEDFFQETADCECSGACNPEEFGGFCDNDSNACGCVENVKTVENCTTYCDSLAGEPDPEEGCYTYSGQAFCNCTNFDCTDAEKVAAQCEAGMYTSCTCGVADPCAWANDGEYCDAPSCNEMFPDQTNFDDTATDCAVQ